MLFIIIILMVGENVYCIIIHTVERNFYEIHCISIFYNVVTISLIM